MTDLMRLFELVLELHKSVDELTDSLNAIPLDAIRHIGKKRFLHTLSAHQGVVTALDALAPALGEMQTRYTLTVLSELDPAGSA